MPVDSLSLTSSLLIVQVDDDEVSRIVRYSPNLRSIHLGHTPVTGAWASAVTTHVIQKLMLSHTKFAPLPNRFECI